MIERLAVWIDQRVGASGAVAYGARKVFPEHWSFLLGELALYSFVILLLTGTYLALFFDASLTKVIYSGAYGPLNGVEVSRAYASVLDLSFGVRAGLFIRQVHHWAALIFIAAIVVHMARIFFTGAFRRPRELNWVIGLSLLLMGMLNGFSGYSLPDDLLSGTGLRIAYSIAQSIPLIGTRLAFVAFGGEYPTEVISSRLFISHVFIVPLVMLGLISAHLGLVIRQKHTQFPGPRATEGNVVGERLWPTYATKSVGLFFLISAMLAALGALAQVNPVWLYGPYEPSTVSTGAQPDWYMGWLEGALRLMPDWRIVLFGFELPNSFFPAVLLPGVTFTGMFLWPFLERFLTGDTLEHHILDRPRDHTVRTSFGASAFAFYSVLFVAGSQDILSFGSGIPVEQMRIFLRVTLFVLPGLVYLATARICRQLRAVDDYRARRTAVREAAGTGAP